MGKKDKKKGKGMEKTLAKTEKNVAKKLKRQSGKKTEEDVELMVKRLASEAALRKEVTESACPPPSPRSSFTLCAHPEREEMLLYGGEHFDGRHTTVFGDLLLYRVKTNEWRHLQLPAAPSARCGHAAVTVPQGGGQMWLVGGEFGAPSGDQFYHYRDLWCLHIAQRRWEKVSATGGPSARSGHRMATSRRLLLVFGGFHDNVQSFTYMNDLHAFCLETRQWVPLQVSGQPPSVRSGVLMLTLSDGRVLITGGYSKRRVPGGVEEGTTHADMFLLVPQSQEAGCSRWSWQLVRQTGARPPLRSGMSGCALTSGGGDRVLLFGGVSDQQSDDVLSGTFYSDLYTLDAGRGHWRQMALTGSHQQHSRPRRRRRKPQSDNAAEMAQDAGVDDERVVGEAPDPADRLGSLAVKDGATSAPCTPSPRAKAGMVARGSKVYLYGGHVERGSVEITLQDFYVLDTTKMDEWKVLVEQPKEINWQGSDDENMDDDDEDDDESGDEEDDESGDEDDGESGDDDSDMEDEDL